MDKQELEKKLYQIDEKLKLKKIQIENSSEYILLETTQKDLWNKKYNKERELEDLKIQIYKKYVRNLDGRMWGLGFKTNAIKSSVKQGIKKGLGITNVALIDKYDLKNIVKELINRDLEKIKIESKIKKIKEIDIQLKRGRDNKNKLMEELDTLTKERKKIDKKLNKKLNEKEYLKNKKIEEKKKGVKIKIHNLPKFMNRIIKEVNKRLMLENL